MRRAGSQIAGDLIGNQNPIIIGTCADLWENSSGFGGDRCLWLDRHQIARVLTHKGFAGMDGRSSVRLCTIW